MIRALYLQTGGPYEKAVILAAGTEPADTESAAD